MAEDACFSALSHALRYSHRWHHFAACFSYCVIWILDGCFCQSSYLSLWWLRERSWDKTLSSASWTCYMLTRLKQGINNIYSILTNANIFSLNPIICLPLMHLLLQISRLASATGVLLTVCDGTQGSHVSCSWQTGENLSEHQVT